MAQTVRLKTHKVLIRAPRELVYQKKSAFGSGRLNGESSESSRVVSRSDDKIIAEFKTRAGPFTITTLEEVTLEPPERITFRHLRGPLHYAREEFAIHDVDAGTELTHDGEFVWSRLPVLGWLAGRLLIEPAFERIIEDHVEMIRVACEARAKRSHVFRPAGKR